MESSGQDDSGYLRQGQRSYIERLGEVSMSALTEYIVAGDIVSAVEAALEHRTEWVESELDYETMDENAEQVLAFFAQWLPALPPLERLQAAEWAAGQFLLPLVHLEHSFGIGAQLYLDAYEAATAELASAFRDFHAFTYGPDAETPASVADRLEHYARKLDEMSFTADAGAPGD